MGTTSWRGQILRALQAINHIGESSHAAKRVQDWKPGMAVKGLYSYGTFNAVFDRAITFTNWLDVKYPDRKLFRNVKREMTIEFLLEKSTTCTTNTLQTLVAALPKLQEGLHAMNWISEDIVPEAWSIEHVDRPRGAYLPNESMDIVHWVTLRSPEYGQALRFILSSGARIDEVFHLRADKIDVGDKRVQLLGKGGKLRRIPVLHADVLQELDLSRRFIYLTAEHGDRWKDGLERYVRQACNALGIQRRGVHGFRATAACEFMAIKRALGYTEIEACKELAMRLGHTPDLIEVTYAYVAKDSPHALAFVSSMFVDNSVLNARLRLEVRGAGASHFGSAAYSHLVSHRQVRGQFLNVLAGAADKTSAAMGVRATRSDVDGVAGIGHYICLTSVVDHRNDLSAGAFAGCVSMRTSL